MTCRRGRQRRRILVSSYALSPVLGSEPGAGWNICSRLAAYHDVTVLARSWDEALWPQDAHHREEVERFMRASGPIPGLTIHFVASPPLSRLLQPQPLVSLRSPFYFQGYAAWQRAAYREAVRLHRERPFDAVHQLTIATFREPGYLWKLGVPFIWGPIAGGENIPLGYFADFGSHDQVYYALKNLANKLHRWTKWRSRTAAYCAARVFVSSAELHGTIARWGRAPTMMPEVGTPNWPGRRRCYDGARPLRLCWIGLHIGRKALPIALRSLAELKARGLGEKVHLTILGTGPETRILARPLRAASGAGNGDLERPSSVSAGPRRTGRPGCPRNNQFAGRHSKCTYGGAGGWFAGYLSRRRRHVICNRRELRIHDSPG